MLRSPRVISSLILLNILIATRAMSTHKRVIDSHLHVWASKQEAETGFPYAEGQEPPEALGSIASSSALLQQMDNSGVSGALIVQPINHKFDHSYVIQSIKDHPTRFKGMLLHDPSLSEADAIARVEDLSLKGFVGVRFNPYLWPKSESGGWDSMANGAGLAVYKRCGELNMPVGIMCFQGLHLHFNDILALLESSPKTKVILDHFAFTSFTEEGSAAFQQLLQLAKYSQVYVKISALFRLQTSSYDTIKSERLEPLLESFGPHRLMFGSDFPYVMETEEQYQGTVQIVEKWLKDREESLCDQVMSGTAEKLFGSWAC